MNFHLFCLLSILSLCSFALQAQDCNKSLDDAQEAYRLGRIDQVENFLLPCLNKNGFDREDQLEVYHLLVVVYLYANEDAKATDMMAKLLKLNPEYRVKPTDNAEFVELYKAFRTRPVLLIGAQGGGNLTFASPIASFSLSNSETQSYVYNALLGFQVGASVVLPLGKRLDAVFKPEFVRYTFSYSTSLFDYQELLFTERSLWVSFPLLFRANFRDKYNFNVLGIKPFIEVGASFDYLLQASATAQRQDRVSENVQRSVTGADVVLTEARNPYNFSLIGGLGAEYKQGRGSFIVSMNFSYGLLNVIDPQKRFDNQVDIFRYGYIDNDHRLSFVGLYAGYLYPIYNPKKIR